MRVGDSAGTASVSPGSRSSPGTAAARRPRPNARSGEALAAEADSGAKGAGGAWSAARAHGEPDRSPRRQRLGEDDGDAVEPPLVALQGAIGVEVNHLERGIQDPGDLPPRLPAARLHAFRRS